MQETLEKSFSIFSTKSSHDFLLVVKFLLDGLQIRKVHDSFEYKWCKKKQKLNTIVS